MSQKLGMKTDVSRAGMDTLQTVGSADFTQKQFDWLLSELSKQGVSPDKITVMDLRGESHGLIDGNVFMLWIENNCVNESKPTETVLEEEKLLLSKLKSQKEVRMYETNDKWAPAFDKDMLSFKDSEIISEKELVESRGAKYIRFADTNHFRPDDHEVDLFVDFMKTVKSDEWLAMHCYAGEGRTTNFMVMTDIFKNYKLVSFDDIAARQGLIGPVDVRIEVAVTGKTHYKMKASIERRIFLQQFYRYAKETEFTGVSWSQWVRDKGISLTYYPDM
ncbi:MAG: hypothetical protein ACI4M9_01325 [Succinivibrio sp.]